MAKSVKSELAMRKALINTIKKAEKSINNNIDCTSWYELDERQKKLQSDFQKLESKNMTIAGMDHDFVIDETEFENENEKMGELCVKLKAKLKEKMAVLERKADFSKANTQLGDENEKLVTENENEKAKQNQESEKANNQMKSGTLLTLSSLKFSIPEWHVFQEEFESKVIDNGDLNNEEKLKALLNACELTEAELVLLRLGERNVESAFNKLKQQFGTAYAQANYFTQALLSIPSLTANHPNDYLNLVNSVDYCIAGLERHMSNDKFVQLIPLMVVNKFDNQTRINWERFRSILLKTCDEKDKFLPDWCTLKGFLQDEAEYHAQFATGNGKQSTGDTKESELSWHTVAKNTEASKSLSSAHTGDVTSLAKANEIRFGNKQENKPNEHCDCAYWHPLHKCKRFLAMNINEREDFIRDRKVCGQCLLAAHMGTPCKDPKANQFCNRCKPFKQVKHNSMMCTLAYNKVNQIAVVPPSNSQPIWNADEEWGNS